MGSGSTQALPGGRGFLGTMLVAWTFVTGCVAVIASAYYARTGELTVLIAWLGAPFLIGLLLFLALGMTSVATRVGRGGRVPPIPKPSGLRRRNDIHGRR